MRQRLISAAILVPVVIAVFLLGAPWLTIGMAVLAALAGWEAGTLARRAGLAAQPALAAVVAAVSTLALPLLVAPSSALAAHLLVGAVALALAAGALVVFAPWRRPVGATFVIGSLVALGYAGLLAFVPAIAAVEPAASPGSVIGGLLDDGRAWLVVLVVTVWALDSAAYLIGRAFPRGRFFNSISPKKTWSGSIGGTVAAVATCAALVASIGHDIRGGLLLGLVIAVSAQAGDLSESMLKRAAGVKDSGSLIPGHGGVLDRVDSFLFAAPALFIALTWIQLLVVERPV